MGMIQAPNQTPADRLDQMVRQYEKDLLRICCIYLRDRTAAEDVVQETFLKAFRNIESFRGESSEKTWLIRIAINCCRDYRRMIFVFPLISYPSCPQHRQATIILR